MWQLERAFAVSSQLLGTYTLTYHGLQSAPSMDDRINTEAVLSVQYNGQPAGELVPLRELFLLQQQPMTIPDKRSTLAN